MTINIILMQDTSGKLNQSDQCLYVTKRPKAHVGKSGQDVKHMTVPSFPEVTLFVK